MIPQEFKLKSAQIMLLFVAVLLPFSAPLHAQSASPKNPRVVNVAARLCPPFVIKANDTFSGLSIFLWDNIAQQLGLDYRIEQYELAEMLEAVSAGQADIAVCCLSITQEREKIVDFSHSFYETHLAIAVKQHGLLQTIKNFLSNKRLLIALAIVVGVAALIGGILYIFEHNINDKLYSMKNRGGKLVEGFIAGLLFVTSGPIRYYEFKTLIGRTLAAFLAVGSTVMIASITALLASTFTLDQMHSKISGPQDLAKVKVGVMEASTSFEYLQERGINGRTFRDRQELPPCGPPPRLSHSNQVVSMAVRFGSSFGVGPLWWCPPFSRSPLAPCRGGAGALVGWGGPILNPLWLGVGFGVLA